MTHETKIAKRFYTASVDSAGSIRRRQWLQSLLKRSAGPMRQEPTYRTRDGVSFPVK